MDVLEELKKDRGFFIVVTKNVNNTFGNILKSIKLSQCDAKLLSLDIKNRCPCNKCVWCRMIDENKYPYLFRIYKESSKQRISIEEIRAYENYFYMKVEELKKKYFIVEKAENLSIEAQNHLLKILEEIPGSTFFFFICRNITDILPTILSRAKKIFETGLAEPIVVPADVDENIKIIVKNVVDFWQSSKKKDINLYMDLKENILSQRGLSYDEKKKAFKIVLEELINVIYNKARSVGPTAMSEPFLVHIIDEILDFLIQLKYNVTLELFTMNFYVKLLKWKNLVLVGGN